MLKDAVTVVAPKRDFCWINQSGNPGMATAGSGDVLSGMLAGVLALYPETPVEEKIRFYAALGVLLHGRAVIRRSMKKARTA